MISSPRASCERGMPYVIYTSGAAIFFPVGKLSTTFRLMMRIAVALVLSLAGVAAQAQLGLPGVRVPVLPPLQVQGVTGTLQGVAGTLQGVAGQVDATALQGARQVQVR